jgi:Mg-chelatase subunit ChlD
VPFGDVAGLLGGKGRGGGANGGPGGSGRGSVFGARPGVGKGVLNVVYVLDCSGSMRDGNKIGKAKEALKKALSELKPTDSFDILSFNGRIYKLSPIMLPATAEIIDAAMLWIDRLRLANHTNISGAMGVALELTPINCVYLMSDGEPEGPETLHDPNEIREYVKQCNTQHAKIMTLALCLGEKYPGEEVMRGLAADAGGDYNYIDLSQVR